MKLCSRGPRALAVLVLSSCCAVRAAVVGALTCGAARPRAAAAPCSSCSTFNAVVFKASVGRLARRVRLCPGRRALRCGCAASSPSGADDAVVADGSMLGVAALLLSFFAAFQSNHPPPFAVPSFLLALSRSVEWGSHSLLPMPSGCGICTAALRPLDRGDISDIVYISSLPGARRGTSADGTPFPAKTSITRGPPGTVIAVSSDPILPHR